MGGIGVSPRSEFLTAFRTLNLRPYWSFLYSALASFRMGMSGSASFETSDVFSTRRVWVSDSATGAVCCGTIRLGRSNAIT